MKGDLWEKELWTQKEVAAYFRASSSTIKNWRDQGLLSYWRVPGSSKVLYYRDEIKHFCGKHKVARKEEAKPATETQRVKPCVSPAKKVWRI